MALVMLLFVDRFGIAFHSSLYPLEPGHAVLNIFPPMGSPILIAATVDSDV
jgi:hypothetical protein